MTTKERIEAYVNAEIANRIALTDLGIPDDRTLGDLTDEEWRWYEPIFEATSVGERLSDEEWFDAVGLLAARMGESTE